MFGKNKEEKRLAELISKLALLELKISVLDLLILKYEREIIELNEYIRTQESIILALRSANRCWN
jgi:hypothetical protein